MSPIKPSQQVNPPQVNHGHVSVTLDKMPSSVTSSAQSALLSSYSRWQVNKGPFDAMVDLSPHVQTSQTSSGQESKPSELKLKSVLNHEAAVSKPKATLSYQAIGIGKSMLLHQEVIRYKCYVFHFHVAAFVCLIS